VLDTNSSEHDLPTTPILLDASAQLPGLWHADGVAGPSRTLLAAAQGLGALVAAADADGPIRRVPLLVLSRGTLRPGLAVEVVRLAQGAAALLIDGEGSLHIGDLTVPLGRDAQLRLVQRAPADWAVHTVGATQVLDDAGVQKLAGKIVLIGGSNA
jgi:adenylate cyclase